MRRMFFTKPYKTCWAKCWITTFWRFLTISHLSDRVQTSLVGGAITILKNDGVRQWEGWHPIYDMEYKTCLKPPTHIYILYIYICILPLIVSFPIKKMVDLSTSESGTLYPFPGLEASQPRVVSRTSSKTCHHRHPPESPGTGELKSPLGLGGMWRNWWHHARKNVF